MLIEKPTAKPRPTAAALATKAYTVVAEFWHAGVLRLEGEIVHLTDKAAKYFGHALAPVEAKIEAKVEAVAAPVAPVVMEVDKVAKAAEKVVEKAADKAPVPAKTAPDDAPADGSK